MKAAITLCLLMFVVTAQAQDDEIEIRLVPGWNFVSINIIPPEDMFDGEENGPDIPLMLERVLEQLDGVPHPIVRDLSGRFYAPAFEFCNIPFWDLTRGYQIQVLEEIVVTWEGERIPADAEINIPEFTPTMIAVMRL